MVGHFGVASTVMTKFEIEKFAWLSKKKERNCAKSKKKKPFPDRDFTCLKPSILKNQTFILLELFNFKLKPESMPELCCYSEKNSQMCLHSQKQSCPMKSRKMVTEYTLRKCLTGLTFAVLPVFFLKMDRKSHKLTKKVKCKKNVFSYRKDNTWVELVSRKRKNHSSQDT